MLRKIFVGFVGFVFCCLCVFGVSYFGLVNYKFFGPKFESARRVVFEQSKSYVYGAVQDLAKYHHEWLTARDDISRKAIESLVRQRFANLDPSVINNVELRKWFCKIIDD